MSPRVLLSCLAAWVAGCASQSPRPDAEPSAPRYEHVYLKPLEEALEETRKLLAEKGYGFEPTEDETVLLTTWQQPQSMDQQWGNQSQYRYLVSGLRLSPRQSVVRIYRMWRTVISNNSENRPYLFKAMKYEFAKIEAQDRNSLEKKNRDRETTTGYRDLPLEKELTTRLESGAGIEVVARNVTPEPDRPQLREPDFYLERWKQEGTAQPEVVRPCPQEVRGLNALLKPGLALLIGEQLGSREAPAVVGDIVCEASAAGLSVVLGLSIPHTEQERINRYLASSGAPSDQDELLRGLFWRRPYQDGRSSRAIMDLIDRVRSLRNYGLFITLVAYDTEDAIGSKRDALLAKVWEDRRKAHPDELFVILAGNTHARTVQGTQWDPDFTPMAKRLAGSGPSVLALDLSYAQGKRWGCDLNRDAKLVCAVVGATPGEQVAAPPGQTPYITLFHERSAEGYHGLLYVGALSPSLPATSLEGQELAPSSGTPRPARRIGR